MDVEVAGPVKVLIADDHPIVLAGVRRALERSEGLELVGEARSAGEVARMIERRRPQLALLDLRMPGSSGFDLLERIRAEWPEVKVVVLSANEDRGSIDGALRAGASAYIVKSVEATDIASVLRQTAGGHVFHAVARGQAPVEPSDEPEAPLLTDRERTILDAVAKGMTTAAISKDLWVSEHTIKFHLTNIYRKLEVPNRACAVRYAVERGLISA
jgi:two-component system nitrate/nitrite response regulator NarL